MKSLRQEKIIELITDYPIDTQKALTSHLKEAGFAVTQATVSRDIAELGLEKVTERGIVRYVYSEPKNNENEKFIRVLREGYLEGKPAGTLVVIKTSGGMAMAVAAALDSLDFPEIVGTIAGDDTIMCAAASVSDAEALLEKIKKII